jgi:hypothetical protein
LSSTVEPFQLPLPPSTAVRFLKILWHVTEVVATGDIFAYSYGMQMRSLPGPGETTEPDEWRRFQVVFDNNQSVVNADMAVFTIDVLNYTNGAIDNSWTQADYDAVQNQLSTFLAALSVRISNRWTWTATRVYRMIFTPQPPLPFPPTAIDKPFEDSGPPVHVYPNATAMTGSGNNIDQFACSVTEETPLRGHWGRFYLPTLSQAQLGANGRLTTVAVDAIADAYNTFTANLAANNFYTVVPNTQNRKQPIRALSNVTGIHVDDVPDVIRRRRPKYVGYKRVHDVNTPAGRSEGMRAELEHVDQELPDE